MGLFRIKTTWRTRYDGLGIPSYIYRRFARANDRLVIVDVGCSNGMALTGCKECLSSRGVEVYAVGIDPHADEAAGSDLDEFIPKDASDVDDHVGEADVVICVNVINDVHRNPKKIFLDALKFLKIGGVMITDAHRIPPEYMGGLRQRSDFERTRLCCSKYSVSYLMNAGRLMEVYEKTE